LAGTDVNENGRKKDDSNVRAVERALQVLDCFSKEQISFSLVEISREIGLYPSTTLRMLNTLENHDYVYRDPDSHRYFLGSRLLQLNQISFANFDYCQIARPYLETLRDEFNESVGVYSLQGDSRVCVMRLNSTHLLRREFNLGERHSLTRGASGKVLLAHQSAETIERLLKENPGSCTKAKLEKAKADGVAVSREEREVGLCSIASPIFNAQNIAVAAIFLSCPTPRFTQEMEETATVRVRETSRQISTSMGARFEGNDVK
jgi:DNA-binding IclR family transcriptional regulator